MCSLKLIPLAVQIAAVMKNYYFPVPFFKGNYFCHNFPFKFHWAVCFIVIYWLMFCKWSRFPPSLKNQKVLNSWECCKTHLVTELPLIWVWLFSMHFSTLHSVWIILPYVCLNNVLWNNTEQGTMANTCVQFYALWLSVLCHGILWFYISAWWNKKIRTT